MTDLFTRDKRSKIMAAIKSRGNKGTEMKLVRILRDNGIKGWQRHQALPGRPDFVFRLERLAVFVDGCFWHVCPKHGRKPDSNKNYWINKFQRNKIRDKQATRQLVSKGWKVIRIWEHSLRNGKRVAKRIMIALNRHY